jgi:hypothetical protein
MSKIFSLCRLSCAWHSRLEDTGTYLLSVGFENVPGEGNRLGWLWSYSQGKSQTKSEYAAAAGIYPNSPRTIHHETVQIRRGVCLVEVLTGYSYIL